MSYAGCMRILYVYHLYVKIQVSQSYLRKGVPGCEVQKSFCDATSGGITATSYESKEELLKRFGARGVLGGLEIECQDVMKKGSSEIKVNIYIYKYIYIHMSCLD
jgi:hypothetical protein